MSSTKKTKRVLSKLTRDRKGGFIDRLSRMRQAFKGQPKTPNIGQQFTYSGMGGGGRSARGKPKNRKPKNRKTKYRK
jgi:hypothetical protein